MKNDEYLKFITDIYKPKKDEALTSSLININMDINIHEPQIMNKELSKFVQEKLKEWKNAK